MACRTREYLCARERIRDLHDWRSFAGLNSLCDICLPLSAASSLFLSIPFFYPSVSRSLFITLFFPHQWRCQTRALPLTAGYDWTNQKQKEKASEEEEDSDLLNSEEKTSSLPVKSAAAADWEFQKQDLRGIVCEWVCVGSSKTFHNRQCTP